jgi:hypothetical protein
MPSRFVVLVMGDWQRFRKYHLITANLILLTIWVLATLAMDKEQLTQFLPFIFLMGLFKLKRGWSPFMLLISAVG